MKGVCGRTTVVGKKITVHRNIVCRLDSGRAASYLMSRILLQRRLERRNREKYG